MRGRNLLLKLNLFSNPGMLCVVRSTVDQLTKEMGFSELDCREVTRALDEALTNIIRHAYKGSSQQPIEVCFLRISARVNEHPREGLEIVITDRGPALDPTKLTPRPLDEVRPGGLGLHFIRQSMHAIKYKRIGRKNNLHLVKYLAPASQQRAI